MMRGKRSLFWLLATGLLASLLVLSGCGDDGSDGIDGTDGSDYAPVQGEVTGILSCSTCHANNSATADWLTSPHANGSSAYAAGNPSCTACHNPASENADLNAAFGVSPTGGVVGCESCHGGGSAHVNLPGDYPVPNPAPVTEQCIGCHSDISSHVERGYTISNNVGENFESSRHANQRARTEFCSSCHSHEGALALLSMDRFTSTKALDAAYNENTVAAYSLPVGSDTIDGVMQKNCATCHDPHTTQLRGMGDITAVEIDGLLPATATTFEEATVVYSAEFNLCTACHMVDINPTYREKANNGFAIIDYSLSDAYSAAEMVDAATGTYAVIELPNAERDVIGAAFYHDGASGNGRTMADTHFGGTILSHLVDFKAGTNDIVIEGYNINAGDRKACTTCHDAHTAGKLLSIDSSSTIDYADQLDNKAVSYAEGLGAFHNSYQTTASYRSDDGAAQSCAPCHYGDAFATYTNEGDFDHIGSSWDTLGCIACHDLAVPNAEPASNNSEAFAAVRTFPTDFEFAFNSGAAVTDDLGNNQVCFECHKGRTAGVTTTVYAAMGNTFDNTSGGVTTTYPGVRSYDISYLHYAPSFATLYGVESEMVATYAGKTYAGRFAHYDGAELGCVDCHDVHNTNGNEAATNKMTNPAFTCVGCHGDATFASVDILQARTEAFSLRLADTILAEMLVAANGGTPNIIYDYVAPSGGGNLYDVLVDLAAAVGRDAQMDVLIPHMEGRVTVFPTKEIAKAVAAWKVFTYEDGAVHGHDNVHGHGGAWAHNSKFARQVMYDAIQDLGGDLTGLVRP